MRASTRIAATTVLAGGLTMLCAGSAFADPSDEVTRAAEEVTGTAGALSPQAETLLENPQVQEILANEDAVELLSDPDALELLQALLELEDPLGVLEELGLPVATDGLPADTGAETGELPVDDADAGDAGDATRPVDDVVGGPGTGLS